MVAALHVNVCVSQHVRKRLISIGDAGFLVDMHSER